jgi:hypothetical protein
MVQPIQRGVAPLRHRRLVGGYGTDPREAVVETCFGLYATIDIHQGQEIAGGRPIDSPVKLLRIGLYAPTGSSAVR